MSQLRDVLKRWLRDDPYEQRDTLRALEEAGLIVRPTKADHDDHYRQLFDRAQRDADRNKAWLFDAWKTMAGQSRGLQRQRRIINRLRAEIAELKREGSGQAPLKADEPT